MHHSATGCNARFHGAARLLMLAAVLCAGLCGPARAASIDFKFEIPTIPFPPQISGVENDPPCEGAPSFEVRATITGQEQKKAMCDKPDRADCEADDWYLIADPEINPNPPAITMARVYYFINGDTQNTKSVNMSVKSGAVWKADIPQAGMVANDVVTFFIATVDSRGNVASQEPDTSERPCEDVTSWDPSLSTPGIDSCSYATSYNECNVNKMNAPGACNTDYTMADRRGDVCGMPDSNGVQQVITGSDADRLDMLGIAAGADSSKICAKIGMAAPPPSSTDPSPIEGYLLIFFNPDIVDPKPADTHITNAYAITFAPEAASSDPTLAKDLWDGDCVTNPDTSNPLDCRLYAPTNTHTGLAANYSNGALRIMVNKSGTGDANLQKSFSLIGNDSNQTIMVGLTGEINLSGGTAFWISDLTPGFAFYRKNKSATVKAAEFCVSNCIEITGAMCSETGSGGTSNICPHTAVKPAQNVCTMNFTDTGKVSGITEYRLFRSQGEDPAAALAAGAVATKPSGASGSAHKFDNAHTALNAENYHYYIGCWNGTTVTSLTDFPQTHGDCTVDDWTPPQKPVITAAATPPGSDAVCRIAWTADGSDRSLKDFLVKRGGETLNVMNPVAANGSSYVWTDPDTLDVSQSYSYTVVARDKVGNIIESEPFACTPRDLKPPAQVASPVSSCAPTPGELGVTLDWQPSPDSDTKGYHVYACNYSLSSNNCTSSDQFTALNSGLLTQTHFESEGAASWVEAKFRFYISSCDKCLDTGSCPAMNCTGFPPLKDDFKDHEVMPCIEITAPSAPANLTAAAAPQGRTCTLQWDRVCSDADGAFPDCDNPESKQIAGYKVVRAQSPNVPDPVSGEVAATVAAGGSATTVSFSNTGLADGVTYYYKVYAFDGSRNYSGGSPEQACTPARTQKPAAPELDSPDYDEASSSCSLEWEAVTDPYPIAYNVYRCQGDMQFCASADKFDTDFDSGNLNLSGTQYQDPTVDSGLYYTYCIASSAGGLISSDVYTASDLDNCGQCFTAVVIDSPKVKAWYSEADTAVKFSMEKSGNDTGAGGYNIYRCTDENCSGAKTKIKSCTDLPATGSNIPEESPLSLSGEPAGTHYYGATYQPDCGVADAVSALAFDRDPISDEVVVPIPPCTGANCIEISSCKDYAAKTQCSPVTRKDTATLVNDKFTLTPQAGLQVFLADKDGNPVGDPATTDSSGNYRILIDTSKTSVDTSKAYQVVLKIPGGQIPGQPCSTRFAGTDCHVELNRNTVLVPGGAAQVRGVSLADCGGGEVGNLNCDDTVNVQDFILLKNCYSSAVGDANYKEYCDVDGSGAVDISDFISMKNYFGLDLPAAPSCPAARCSQ